MTTTREIVRDTLAVLASKLYAADEFDAALAVQRHFIATLDHVAPHVTPEEGAAYFDANHPLPPKEGNNGD